MALVKCAECGREISTEAKACPGCGVRRGPSGRGGAILAISALAVVGFIVVVMALGGRGNQDVVASLRAKQPQCAQSVAGLQRLGVEIERRGSNTEMHINEPVWAALTHDDKVRQALLVFCSDMPASGDYSVYVYGLHNGKMLASVVNGNYFDN